MPSALESLIDMVPPPPDTRPDIDWGPTERALRTALPADYKQLVDEYGPGSFDGFLWILQPSDTNENLDLLTQRTVRLDALRTLQADGEPVPYSVEKDMEDLIPWATSDNGDVCYWVTYKRDAPDTWTVAVNESRGPLWAEFNGSATAFLVALLSGSLRVDLFPDDFPTDRPLFVPLEP